jgi:outer membrane protein
MLLVLGLCAGSWVQGQKPMTLQACLAHAEQHNLSLQQVKLQVAQTRVAVIQSWVALMPSLNGSASQSTNFGLRFDPTSGILQDQKFESFSTGISSNFVIFNGLSNYNSIAQNQKSYEAEKAGYAQAIDDLHLNVTDLFMQVMFAEERVKIAAKQFDLLKAQTSRMQMLWEAGNVVKGEFLTLKAQTATQEVQFITAQNALKMAKLALAQALMLEPETLVLSYPPLDSLENVMTAPLPDPKKVMASAVTMRPGLIAAQLRRDAARFGLRSARGNYVPTIGLNASASTIYSGLRKQNPFDPASPPIPFNQQMKENFGQQVSFSLSVPLLNGWSTRAAVQQAKIGLARAELSILEQENQLRNTIERAHADALAAYQTWQANQINLQALEEARQYAEDRFSVQAINALQFNDAVTRYFQAQTELLIAHYDFIFKSLVLQFYQGNRFKF